MPEIASFEKETAGCLAAATFGTQRAVVLDGRSSFVRIAARSGGLNGLKDLQGEQTMQMTFQSRSTKIQRALSAIGVSLLLVGVASAQVPQGGTQAASAGALSPYPTKIGVLDVKQIFEQHASFKQQMDTIDVKVKKLQADTAAMQKWAQEQQKTIQDMPKGPTRDAAEAQVASEMAQFRVKEAVRRKSILTSEATVYYNTWRNIEQAVAAHCQRQRIDLVVRYDSRPINPDERGSIMASVNRTVVHQEPQLNITPAILAAVNASVPTASRPNNASQFLPR